MTETAKPPIERHQHDRIIRYRNTGDASRVARRVQPPVELLYKRYTIDQRQYDAAMQWLDDYEIGHEGARDLDGGLPAGVSAGTAEGYTIRQIHALTLYRQGYQAMGKHCSWIAVEVVLRRRTLSQVAESCGKDRKHLAGILDVALNALADYYRR